MRWVLGRSRGWMLSRTEGQLPGSCCRPPQPTPSTCSTTAQGRWVAWLVSTRGSRRHARAGHSAVMDRAAALIWDIHSLCLSRGERASLLVPLPCQRCQDLAAAVNAVCGRMCACVPVHPASPGNVPAAEQQAGLLATLPASSASQPVLMPALGTLHPQLATAGES